jgi:hypothetical protein
MERNDGLNNPLSINSGIGCTWGDVERRCEGSDAVESYRDGARGIEIRWAGEQVWDSYSDPQAALIAIREMESAS